MPWCDNCSRFLTPTSLRTGGACPTCGRTIAEGEAAPRAPWHFKLMLVCLGIYLAWRFGQLVGGLL